MVPSILAALTFAAQFVPITTLQDYLQTGQTYRSFMPPVYDHHLRTSRAMDEVQNLLTEDVQELAEAFHVAEVSSSGIDPYGTIEPPLAVPAYAPAVNSMPSSGLQFESLQAISLQACPNGYALTPGDVPGGDGFGRGFTNLLESIDVCADDCNGRPACLSFEYSPMSKNCYLNTIVTPTSEALGDTLFCAKTDALQGELANLQAMGGSMTMNTTGNMTRSNVTSNGSNSSNATPVGYYSAEPAGKELLLTFHGRVSEALGISLWALILLVGCCCCSCILWVLWTCLRWLCADDAVELDEDEDAELHEVWVRDGSKPGAVI
jgi:hypothetical protein